jgi:hypothetical protein
MIRQQNKMPGHVVCVVDGCLLHGAVARAGWSRRSKPSAAMLHRFLHGPREFPTERTLNFLAAFLMLLRLWPWSR